MTIVGIILKRNKGIAVFNICSKEDGCKASSISGLYRHLSHVTSRSIKKWQPNINQVKKSENKCYYQ